MAPLNDDIDIGKVRETVIQKKTWPTMTLIVLIVATIIVFAQGLGVDNIPYILAAGGVWIVFLLCQAYRFSHHGKCIFGDKGFAVVNVKNNSNDVKAYSYDDVRYPVFDIVDRRVNGVQASYKFTVKYSVISFEYESDGGKYDGYEYECSHALFRNWSIYAIGRDNDYDEGAAILQARMNKYNN